MALEEDIVLKYCLEAPKNELKEQQKAVGS